MPTNPYGIDAYPDWNTKPLGGGCGYTRLVLPSQISLGGDTFVRIVYNKSDLLFALNISNTVLQNHLLTNRVIFIHPLAEIDFTGVNTPIFIPGNTILCSNRGEGDSEGALLYTTDNWYNGPVWPLFAVTEENVRITGLRIAGPDQSNHCVIPLLK